MRSIKKGATGQSVYVEILDSTSTTGGRKTGLVFNTSSLTAYYARNGGSAVAITLATLGAANSAWSSGGFKEVDATNMPGVYRLDVPDAAFVAGAETVVMTLKGATGMAQVSLEVQLVDNTPADVFSRLGAPVGASISADLAGVQADTDNIQTRLPAALVSGRIDASVGAMATDVITSGAVAASAVTELQAGLSTLDVAGVRTAVGLASANLDTQLSTIAGYIDTEVGAIKAKTDNLPAAPAAVSDIPTANANADALLDRAAGVETGWTFRQAMRIMLSVLAGKASGLDTTSAVYRDMADSKNRIAATVDANGNRSAVTRDAS